MQTTLCGCNPNAASFQPVSNNAQADRTAQQRTGSFNNNSLSGDETSDQLLLGLILVLVQLLMQQFSGGQGGNGGSQANQQTGTTPTDDGALDFNDNDKALLLQAIGKDPATGTQIQRVNDTDSSGNLNRGDNIDLLTGTAPEVHIITDEQSRSFIEARNPPGTPTVTLSAAQTQALEQRFNLEDVSVADINGDGQFSEGDFISGERDQGTSRRIRIDIPVNTAVLGSVNL